MFRILALLASCAASTVLSGCISYRSARGLFLGPISAVPVQTVDRKHGTAYVIEIEQGPMFAMRGTSMRWPTVGHRAVLVKNKKGSIYVLDDFLECEVITVKGVLRPGFADLNGKQLAGGTGAPRLPGYCLEVVKVAPGPARLDIHNSPPSTRPHR